MLLASEDINKKKVLVTERSRVRVTEEFSSLGSTVCADWLRYPFHPRVTAVARKRSLSSCQAHAEFRSFVKVEVAVLGLPVLISLMVSVDVKQRWTMMLTHCSQFVPNTSTRHPRTLSSVYIIIMPGAAGWLVTADACSPRRPYVASNSDTVVCTLSSAWLYGHVHRLTCAATIDFQWWTFRTPRCVKLQLPTHWFRPETLAVVSLFRLADATTSGTTNLLGSAELPLWNSWRLISLA